MRIQMRKGTRIKCMICIILLPVLLVTALYAKKHLSAYKDVFAVVYEGADYGIVTSWETEAAATVYRYGSMRAESNGRVQWDVSCYRAEGSLFELIPMRLMHGSLELSEGSVLIGYELAWRMFSTADCIGSFLTLDGRTYTVSGVFEQTLKDRVTAKERHAVYMPLTKEEAAGAEGVEKMYIARAKSGWAPILISRWERSQLHVTRAVNLDAGAQFSAFITDSLLIAGLLVLWFAFKHLQRGNPSKTQRFIVLGLWAGLSALIVYFTLSLRFGMDSRFIPASLIEPADYAEAFWRWVTLNNRQYLSGCLLSARLSLESSISVLSGALFLLAGCAFRYLKTENIPRELFHM